MQLKEEIFLRLPLCPVTSSVFFQSIMLVEEGSHGGSAHGTPGHKCLTGCASTFHRSVTDGRSVEMTDGVFDRPTAFLTEKWLTEYLTVSLSRWMILTFSRTHTLIFSVFFTLTLSLSLTQTLSFSLTLSHSFLFYIITFPHTKTLFLSNPLVFFLHSHYHFTSHKVSLSR